MKALIYGRPGCHYCEKAKSLCKLKGIPFDYKIVGDDIQKEQLEEMVGTKVSSVPQIFLTAEGLSEYVGGYTSLEARLNG
ncbi:Glutaredoxin-1 [compost metagenome]